MPASQPIITQAGLSLETEGGSVLITQATSTPTQPIGTQSDILNRLQQLLPKGWFPNGQSPIKDALLTGAANMFAFIYSLFAYVRQQTRIATATDGFLDMAAQDFFGDELLRLPAQTDPSYRARIQSALFLERNTRAAVTRVLTQLTGRAPIIFEPQRPADTGAYNNGSLGYGVAGGYGSMAYPYQSFVTAFRPKGTGIPNIAGYNIPTGAYSTGSQAEYVSQSMIGGIQDNDIYAAIDSVKTFGTIIWARISN